MLREGFQETVVSKLIFLYNIADKVERRLRYDYK